MKCLWADCAAEVDPELFKEHMDSHIKNSASFVCQWEGCPRDGEAFSNKYSLHAHARVHTGEKPFCCKICQKNFSRADALNKHVKRHEAEEQQTRKLLNKLFYLCEQRDIAEEHIKDLIIERQLQTDCLRLLNDELLRGEDSQTDCDTWADYL